MKIAITGAHRVGKTTLAAMLEAALPAYERSSEPYYELEALGHGFSDEPTVDDYLLQLDYSIEQISKDVNKVIFDRCPLDFLAYIHAIDKAENSQTLYPKVQHAMMAIDLLVFLPIEEPDLIACPASALPELRFQVNELLHNWLFDFDIATIEVQGTVSDRLAQVIKRVSTL